MIDLPWNVSAAPGEPLMRLLARQLAGLDPIERTVALAEWRQALALDLRWATTPEVERLDPRHVAALQVGAVLVKPGPVPAWQVAVPRRGGHGEEATAWDLLVVEGRPQVAGGLPALAPGAVADGEGGGGGGGAPTLTIGVGLGSAVVAGVGVVSATLALAGGAWLLRRREARLQQAAAALPGWPSLPPALPSWPGAGGPEGASGAMPEGLADGMAGWRDPLGVVPPVVDAAPPSAAPASTPAPPASTSAPAATANAPATPPSTAAPAPPSPPIGAVSSVGSADLMALLRSAITGWRSAHARLAGAPTSGSAGAGGRSIQVDFDPWIAGPAWIADGPGAGRAVGLLLEHAAGRAARRVVVQLRRERDAYWIDIDDDGRPPAAAAPTPVAGVAGPDGPGGLPISEASRIAAAAGGAVQVSIGTQGGPRHALRWPALPDSQRSPVPVGA